MLSINNPTYFFYLLTLMNHIKIFVLLGFKLRHLKINRLIKLHFEESPRYHLFDFYNSPGGGLCIIASFMGCSHTVMLNKILDRDKAPFTRIFMESRSPG